jgi:hypothetical protein
VNVGEETWIESIIWDPYCERDYGRKFILSHTDLQYLVETGEETLKFFEIFFFSLSVELVQE